jgi:hypothetical protein
MIMAGSLEIFARVQEISVIMPISDVEAILGGEE